jgi:hypothetical protein
LERDRRKRAVDLCFRPDSDRAGRRAGRGDVGALPGPSQDPLPGGVRYAHRAFDQEHAERLIIDRPGKKFRTSNAYISDGRLQTDARNHRLRQFARQKAHRADQCEPNRSAARGGVEYVDTERQPRGFSERQPGIVGERHFKPRRLAVERTSSRKTDALALSGLLRRQARRWRRPVCG